MFGNNEGKPVNIVIVESTYIDGRPVEAGTKLTNVPADLAMELAAAGKARLAVEGKKAAKAEQAPA